MTPELRAIEYAKRIIESYQLDLRHSHEFAGVDLVEKGFCQGVVYRDAIATIDRIATGELVV